MINSVPYKSVHVITCVRLTMCIKRMFTLVWLVGIVLLRVVVAIEPVEITVNSSYRPITCKQFEDGARFVPHDVVDSLWRIFYFWAKGMEISTILFSLPSEKKINSFRSTVMAVNPQLDIDWENSALFMEPRPGVQVLLVSKGRNGSFLAVVKTEDPEKESLLRKPHVHVTEVRMKLVDRYIGVVNCQDHTAFAMARIAEMPTTNEACQAAAATLALKPHIGKCYLSVQELRTIDEL